MVCHKCDSGYYVTTEDMDKWGELTFLCPACREASPLAELKRPQVSPRLKSDLEAILEANNFPA